MGKEWRFTQLAGARRVVTLTGGSAPHGRPRQRPIVSDAIKLRKQRVYYPASGSTARPTTHIFGTEWGDWELQGRFSDRELGPGGTLSAIRDWQQLVVDGHPVEVLWGDVLNAEGIVDSFEPGRESEFECTYKIALLIDRRAFDGGFVDFEVPRSPAALCQALQAELDANVANVPRLPNAGDLRPDFLDSLEEAVSSINGFSASLIAIAGDIDFYAEATFDQLERLRAGVAQTRTALNRLQRTYETTGNRAALLYAAADADVQWAKARLDADVSMLRMLAILDDLDRESRLAQVGRTIAIYTARFGDTWESIATQFYGGPADAGSIRGANGVLYGALPTPGQDYKIPVRV